MCRRLRERSLRRLIHPQPPYDIVQKLRKMAGALLKIQRDVGQLGFLLDSGEPFLDHLVELTFKNVGDTCESANTGTVARHQRRICRLSPGFLLVLSRSGSPFILRPGPEHTIVGWKFEVCAKTTTLRYVVLAKHRGGVDEG